MTGVWAEQLCKQPTEMPCGRRFFLRSTEYWPGCSQRLRVCVVLSLGCLWPLPHLGSNPNPTQSFVGGNGSTYVRLNQGREPWQPAVSPSSNVGVLEAGPGVDGVQESLLSVFFLASFIPCPCPPNSGFPSLLPQVPTARVIRGNLSREPPG